MDPSTPEKPAPPTSEPALPPAAKFPSPVATLTEKDLKRMNRRELLKLAPVALAGAFLAEKWSRPLLREGVAFSDWSAQKYFSKKRLAPTFKDSEVVPFEKFPYNGYDVIDPEVDLESWTLNVEGLAQKPGEYQLHHKVYAREGESCRRCRQPIVRQRIGGRSTFFCEACQV